MTAPQSSMVGRLVYVIGPSGAGKDSILQYSRDDFDKLPLLNRPPIVFAHRYITRPLDAGGENHVALSQGEFKLRLDQGCFAMNWESHDLCYGIGQEINGWMEAGLSVVVNGSRAYLDVALKLYPTLLPVMITVEPRVLKSRLEARGRESSAQIEERLAKASAFHCQHAALIEIDNSGPLSQGGTAFCTLITGLFC